MPSKLPDANLNSTANSTACDPNLTNGNSSEHVPTPLNTDVCEDPSYSQVSLLLPALKQTHWKL